MGSRKVYKFRELIKVLKDHDSRFEAKVNRAKGSERMIYHPDVDGKAASYPIKCHGEGDEIKKGHYPHIIRRFRLPKDLL